MAENSTVTNNSVMDPEDNLADYNTIQSGGSISVYNVLETNNTISPGKVVLVSGANSTTSNLVQAGAIISVIDNGSANYNSLTGGAIIINGGQANYNTIENGTFYTGSIIVKGSGIAQENLVGYGGLLKIESNGSAVSNHLSAGYARISAGDKAVVEYNDLDGTSAGIIGTGKFNYNVISGYKSFLSIYSAASGNSFAEANGNLFTSTTSMFVGTNALATYNSIGTGAYISVANGAVASSNTIMGSAVTEGFFNNNTIKSGAIISVLSGGTVQYNNIEGAIVSIISGGSFSYNTVNNNANIQVSGFDSLTLCSIISNTINSGTSLTLNDYAISEHNEILNGGSLYIGNNVTINGDIINSGGTAFIKNSPKTIINSIIIKNGGNASYGSAVSLTGTMTIEQGGSATIYPSTSGIINLPDGADIYLGDTSNVVKNTSRAVITINEVDQYTSIVSAVGYTSITTKIQGFSDTTQINLPSLKRNEVSNVIYPDDDHVTFIMKDHSQITLNILGVKNLGYALSSNLNGSLIYEVCFLTGTLISTKGGTCAVEDINVGDKITTYNYQKKKYVQRKVKWIGKKSIIVNTHAERIDIAGYPVRILKNAIAENIPNKDLLITPEHCLFFEDKFIPVRMLVNGSTIFYDTSITSYDYYHIETEQHSVVIADGMLTESYLDTGNRHIFNLDQKIIETSFGKYKNWQDNAAAPLLTTRNIVEPIYRQIEQRAKTLGIVSQITPYTLIEDDDFHLITDTGVVLYEKRVFKDGHVIFMLPSDVNAVWIVSRTSRFSDVIGSFVDDRRDLGLLIGKINLYHESKIFSLNTHLTTVELEGWDVQENTPCRWTNGRAYLPLEHKRDTDSSMLLLFEVLSEKPYVVEQKKENIKKKA